MKVTISVNVSAETLQALQTVYDGIPRSRIVDKALSLLLEHVKQGDVPQVEAVKKKSTDEQPEAVAKMADDLARKVKLD